MLDAASTFSIFLGGVLLGSYFTTILVMLVGIGFFTVHSWVSKRTRVSLKAQKAETPASQVDDEEDLVEAGDDNAEVEGDEEYEGDVEDQEEYDIEPLDDDEYVDAEDNFADKTAQVESGEEALVALAATQETGQVDVDEKASDSASITSSQPTFQVPLPLEKPMQITLLKVQPMDQLDSATSQLTKSFSQLPLPPCSCSTNANSTSTMTITACLLHSAMKSTSAPLKMRGNIASFN